MWKLAGSIVRRLLGGMRTLSDRAAAELGGMGPRELCDLGIGISEIPHVLAGGGRGRQEPDLDLVGGNVTPQHPAAKEHGPVPSQGESASVQQDISAGAVRRVA